MKPAPAPTPAPASPSSRGSSSSSSRASQSSIPKPLALTRRSSTGSSLNSARLGQLLKLARKLPGMARSSEHELEWLLRAYHTQIVQGIIRKGGIKIEGVGQIDLEWSISGWENLGRPPRFKLKIRPGKELREFMKAGSERLLVEIMQKMLREQPAAAVRLTKRMQAYRERVAKVKAAWLKAIEARRRETRS